MTSLERSDRPADGRPNAVLMIVFNNFKHDSRVLREAECLLQDGYEVTVVAVKDHVLPKEENRNGIRVRRVLSNPIVSTKLRLSRTRRWVFEKRSAAVHRLSAVRSRFARGIVFFNSVVANLLGGISSVTEYGSDGITGTQDLTIRERCLAHLDQLKWVFGLNAAGDANCLRPVSMNDGPKPSKAAILLKTVFMGIVLCLLIFARTITQVIRLTKRLLLLVMKSFLAMFSAFISILNYSSGKILSGAFTIMARSIELAFQFIKLAGVWRLSSMAFFNLNVVRYAYGRPFRFVHSHDLNTLVAGYWISRIHGAKLVYDSHELYLDRNKAKKDSQWVKRLKMEVEKRLIRSADAVITVNDSIADILASRYRVEKPTVIMNIPVFPEMAEMKQNGQLRKETGIPDQERILLYVGNITIHRGLENLLLAMAELPECFLVLMGYANDAYKARLMDFARTHGVENRFCFFGPVPSDQVVAYTSGADIGVAPIENACLSYYYCSPNKLFEYLAAGIPIIASDFPELGKIVHGFGVGRTFDPSSPKAIAAAARHYLNHPVSREDIVRKHAQIVSVFNWPIEAGKLRSLYRSMH